MSDPREPAKKVFGDLTTPENVEIVRRKEDLPEELPEAVYVVVDVMYFSTTSVEILEGGADQLVVYRELKEKDETEVSLLGGERDESYGAKDGYDLFNSPSFVEELELEDRSVGLTSTNGAETVHLIEQATSEGAETVIGSTVNAKTTAEYLKESDKPVYIIACGRRGEEIMEDYLGAYLISAHMEGEVTEELENNLLEVITDATEAYYDDIPDRRRKDLENHIKNLDGSKVVPVKNGSDPIRFQ
ncbi:2-phosphosulfolactate phosphatase [Candidatus Nanohalococcus occultus]|uniref:2-phosphosulfolactate phosphatase n=1 Tax=Candidatus Nanohalococcus occultus TaxID=2978047 RepID=A0ABY8CFJ0_9ARCH|nr:2-phosphosulfolactate phosphatase [Candidatus Nanohaloarchaeota archaeon SVXNc]